MFLQKASEVRVKSQNTWYLYKQKLRKCFKKSIERTLNLKQNRRETQNTERLKTSF